jgi:two-component sensor histidine kinase/DNA-binding response OmpR family regulator
MIVLVATPVARDRECLQDIIARLGHSPVCCETGREALRLAGAQRPDLAVIAASLPDMDGRDVCRRLRAAAQGRDLPVVLILDEEWQAVDTVQGAGADDYLVRMFDPRGAEVRLRLALQSARSRTWIGAILKASELVTGERSAEGNFADVAQCLHRVVPVNHFVIALEEEREVALEVVEIEAMAAPPRTFHLRLPKADACPQRFRDPGCGYRMCAGVKDVDAQFAGGMRSCVCLPLRDGEHLLGALSLSSREPHAFDASHLPHLESLAIQVAHAVANTRRYQQAKTEAARLAVIVREVHHRIKNNLQGVIGLLGRHREAHPELAAVLNRAVAQLHAVAEVHNLLSHHTRETVNLNELIEGVCRTVAVLAPQRIEPVLGAATAALAVSASEAVPIALILNELIQNAVNHGYPGGAPGTIRVSLAAERAGTRLRVADDGVAPPPGLDSDSGAGFGVGLSLVRALLPRQASLRLYREGGWTVAEVGAPS